MYPSFFERMYTRYLTAITARSIRQTDLILAASVWLEEQVKKRLQDPPTQVLYVGINPKKWDLQATKESVMTLSIKHPAVVGVFPFNQYAKVSGLIKFTRVVRRMKDVNFYFAGNGPYLDLVKQECPSNMLLVGGVPGTQIKEFLKRGDIFVHPSGLDVLPRSVKEAALMEKPIVASDEGGIPEIVKNGQTGYLCDIDDADQWIGRIRFLLDHPDFAGRLGEHARDFVVETFSWGKIAESFVKTLTAFGE
jgi:glycosyltransferase involved in cell wall biosynthesis